MSDWVGGLPPAAHARVERQRASGTSGALLSAPATASLRSAGLRPVGEAFGCLVMNLGWTNSGCGYGGMPMNTGAGPYRQRNQALSGGYAMPNTSLSGGYMPPPQTAVLSTARGGMRYAAFNAYVRAFEAAWQGALDRMLAEARALEADGVVGVRIGRSHLTGQAWEFQALGTAVRSTDGALVRRASGPADVWAANLSAEECAAAILSARVPAGIVLGLVVATKHDDWLLRQQRRITAGNTEIDGLTELLQVARSDARALAAKRAAALGGDLVISGMTVREFETPCNQESDYHAEAVVVGTVLKPGPRLPFRAGETPATSRVLSVMPMTDRAGR